MSVRMHIFRDDVGTFKLGDWHLIVVRVPEHEEPVFSPPDAEAHWIMHVSAPDRNAVIGYSKAAVLHDMLRRREGPDHACDFCDELGPE